MKRTTVAKIFFWCLREFFLNFFLCLLPFWGERRASVGTNRDTKHKTLWRARKKTARSSFALPPLRARSLLLLLDFFSFALSLLLARVPGKVSGNKQRERGVRSFFNSSYFFASLSLSLLCRSLSFSLSLCFRAMLLRCSRLVTKQHSYLSSPSSSLTQNKKSKSASRARM